MTHAQNGLQKREHWPSSQTIFITSSHTLPQHKGKTESRKSLEQTPTVSEWGHLFNLPFAQRQALTKKTKNKLTIHLGNASTWKEGILMSQLTKHVVHQLVYPILELSFFTNCSIKENSIPVTFVLILLRDVILYITVCIPLHFYLCRGIFLVNSHQNKSYWLFQRNRKQNDHVPLLYFYCATICKFSFLFSPRFKAPSHN